VSDSPRKVAGLGGWLIFVGIGLVVRPLWILTNVAPSVVAVFTNGSWHELTTPGSPQFHPLWRVILLYELVGNLGIVLAGIWLLVLFVHRSPSFPKWFIGLAVFVPLFILGDSWLSIQIHPEEPFWDPPTILNFTRTTFSGLLWIPYMLLSKRVRATFVSAVPAAP
jgi:ABC-type multidrug transport system permease subunit